MSLFSPLDLLLCDADEQDILRFLMRRPHSAEPEIIKQTKLSAHRVKETLADLIKEGRIESQTDQDQKTTYHVRMKVDRSKNGRSTSTNLLDSLFD